MFVTQSLDHLVGTLQKRLRDREAERLRDFQVDHQLEPSRLLDEQVGGLGADWGPAAQLTSSQLA